MEVCRYFQFFTYRSDIIAPGEFHGAAFYSQWREQDQTYAFLNTVADRFPDTRPRQEEERTFSQSAAEEVSSICAHFGLQDRNLVKPGIGEATRVLLRRMPWMILVRSLHDAEHLGHLYQLAKEKGTRLVEYPLEHYRACGLIQALADN